jgi:hypothetical protein
VIVYRSQERSVETAGLVNLISEQALARPLGEPLYDLLISFGELEAGVVDADESASPVLRRAAVALGRLFYHQTTSAWERFKAAFARVQDFPLPPGIRISVPEGYAFYALYPEMYIEAARRFVSECRPRNVCVIGIRSIGTSLSAVVAGTLEELGCQARSYTVRPHGHPFDRKVDLPDLPRDVEWYAIVDEGPGLSGSSFAAVAGHFPTERVVLFPSWEGDPGRFLNERARTLWPQYRKYCASYEPSGIAGQDVSAGKWRDVLGAQVAVQPQHEARKYLAGSTLYKFSGLGNYGRDKFERAGVLAGAGYSPRPKAFQQGFIAFDFLPALSGRRCSVERLAEYLAFRRREFAAERSITFDQMAEMIAFNAGGDLGEFRSQFEDRPATAIDGRMMPHEWIETAPGWLKCDSVDHCCDHFFPGFADIAWDLAGASVEFRLSSEDRDSLLGAYRAASGDRVSDGLLQFYEVAYLAFRIGYVSMAAQSTAGTPDQQGFEKLQSMYKRRLKTALEMYQVTA